MADVVAEVAVIPRQSADGFEYFVCYVVEDTAMEDLSDAVELINNPV
jgi:hypothetical protein